MDGEEGAAFTWYPQGHGLKFLSLISNSSTHNGLVKVSAYDLTEFPWQFPG